MKTLTVSAVALVALAFSAPGLASTALTCPDGSPDREVTIVEEKQWTCGLSGQFTIPGEGGNVPDTTFSDKLELLESDASTSYMTISGIGKTEGTFAIQGGLENVVLVFKFGAEAQPEFISFYWGAQTIDDEGVLTEGGATPGLVSGTWQVTRLVDGEPTARGDLSNVRLYGVEGDDFVPPEQVPEPATLMLLGMGLLGLAVLRRRRMI